MKTQQADRNRERAKASLLTLDEAVRFESQRPLQRTVSTWNLAHALKWEVERSRRENFGRD
jgi:hypothetical protein